jgi:Flp pilus assembly protein TadG
MKKHIHTPVHHSIKGQSLIEFALLIPILLLLVFAIIDLGRIIYVYSAMQNSVREGARYGIINPLNTSEIENRVRQSAAGLDQSVLQVQTTYPTDAINVRLHYSFRALTPLVPSILGVNPLLLNAQATMFVEK